MRQVRQSILAQHGRLVVVGIKTNADQVRFSVVLRIVGQFFLDGGELSAQQRAVVRKRTACVDERKKDGLSLELCEMQGLAVLINHWDIRNSLPNREDLWGRGLGGRLSGCFAGDG